MPYAVLQTNLDAPSLPQLERAARVVPGLTVIDAQILGADAFGILVKNFSAPQAAALQGALRTEGVETEIVDQSLLPPLPPVKLVHRLQCQPVHLLVYDPLGHPLAVPWEHIMIVAAGCVRVSEFVRERREQRIPGQYGEYDAQVIVEYDSKEQRNNRFLAEFVLTDAVLRFGLAAEKFNFSYLGARQTRTLARDFTLLIQDALQFATRAARNRGAEMLGGRPEQMFLYPSKNAFHEEIVWMLWQKKSR